MSGKLYESPDRELVKEALGYIRASGDHEATVINWLNDLLVVLKALSLDQETEKAKHYSGITPKERREQLAGIVCRLKEITDTLEVFKAPMLRHEADRSAPPTRPIGLVEFRRAMANRLTMALSADYISRFGVTPIQWNPTNASLGPINTSNRAAAIETAAESIVVDLLSQIALGIGEAKTDIARNTPAGGPRKSKIRELLLLNLVVLWERIHRRNTVATYNGGQTKFFHFCRVLSRSIGAGGLCTETHLTEAVKTYNAKTFPETQPSTDPCLRHFGNQ